MRTPALHIYSHVGGGPMERLARHLTDQGVGAEVTAMFSPAAWRTAMAQGSLGRAKARVASLLVYPAQMLWSAVTRRQIMVATTNPFTLPWLAVATKPLHQNPVVVLVYDLYPDALEAGGMLPRAGLLTRLAVSANRFCLAHADRVVFIGHRMAEHVQGRYGSPRRSAVIETGADALELGAGETPPVISELDAWCEARSAVVSYVGNMGAMHDWETLALALPRALPLFAEKNVGVVIAASGPGVEQLRARCRELEGKCLRFEPPLEDAQWARLLRRTSLSLVTLRDAAAQTCIPSKAFSAMAAGSALAVVAPLDSDLARLARAHDAGWVVSPGDREGLERLLRFVCEDATRLRRARAAALAALRAHYDMPSLARRWRELLGDVPNPEPLTKRCLDLTLTTAALAVSAPVLAAASLAVLGTMGRPVFFRQERAGKDGKPFRLWKFRTMRHPRPGEEGPEHDVKRLTRLGKLLRSTSVDELPSLVNVLAGDMSLVGPRPLLMRYLPRYSRTQARRHAIKPGITGWAQVNGRNALSWEEKLALDVWYVDHQSLLLDLKILARTVIKVLQRQGISSDGHATMPEFMGSEASAG